MITSVLHQEPALRESAPAPLLAARAEALFASDLSARCEYTQVEVVAAIAHAIRAHGGIRGCAAEVAAAYGDHPETAAPRMRWARAVVEGMDASASNHGAATPGGVCRGASLNCGRARAGGRAVRTVP
jgi:hypothetical protein